MLKDLLDRLEAYEELIAEEIDPRIKAKIESKMNQLKIEILAEEYPFIFKNPRILESETDITIGCIKVPNNTITFFQYKSLVEKRIGILLNKYVRKKVNDINIDKLDEEIDDETNIEDDIQAIIDEAAERISEAIDADICTNSCTEEDILDAITESAVFRKWLYEIELRFNENSKNQAKEVDIHGSDPDLVHLYDKDAYKYIENISLGEVIEALYFYKDE